MTSVQYILLILLAVHLALSIYAIIKSLKTNTFSKQQKIYNIILIILIPFIWSLLIYYMLKPEPYSYEIEVKNDESSNNYDESGLGAPGAGISDR